MIAGTAICTVGAGLLNTLEVDTGMPKWVGYQVLYGVCDDPFYLLCLRMDVLTVLFYAQFGLGLCFQAPNLAAQTVLPKNDVSIGASLMFFSQILGGAIFVSVGQNVLNNQLLQRLAGIPGFTPDLISSGGATSLIESFSGENRDKVLLAYNESLRTVFRVGLVLAALSVIGAASMEWRSVKKDQKGAKPSDVEAGAAQDATDDRSDAETLGGGSTHQVDDKPTPLSDEKSKNLSEPSVEK